MRVLYRVHDGQELEFDRQVGAWNAEGAWLRATCWWVVSAALAAEQQCNPVHPGLACCAAAWCGVGRQQEAIPMAQTNFAIPLVC